MEQVAGVILAGGLSRRMGGGDKGLRTLAAKPMLGHVLDRLAPQAFPVAINANGEPARFAAFGLSVIHDATSDFAGPLAGILAGMRWAEAAAPHARFIVTAACDTPFFPKNLVQVCLAKAGTIYPAAVLAKSNEQIHPVFGLWPIALAGDLEAALASGMRKVLDWAGRHPNFTADFAPAPFGNRLVDPFFNANTPAELDEAEAFFAAERIS